MTQTPSTSANIQPGATVAASCRLGDYVTVHTGAVLGDDCEVLGFTQLWDFVTLERGVHLGPGVALEQPQDAAGAIVLGAGCRVGANATIRRGVRIGEGAVVDPGSVVAQPVPPYAIVSGAPARVTGYVEQLAADAGGQWHNIASFPAAPAVVGLGVGGVTLHRHKMVGDPRGDLVYGEFPTDVPFEVKRYFLVFNVPSEKTRGEHAHRRCKQYLICVKGSCALVVDDGKARCEVVLDSPDQGVYLPPMTWGIQYKYSPDAVLLVLTSEYYEASDYIRNYAEFLDEVRSMAQ